MNKVPLIEVEPKELQFIFELRRQSTCSVQLTNTTKHYVAFKVKATSPKKYSVQPNFGVLMPKSTSRFIVTMQAPKIAPIDMVSKDKFLIQSTMVPAETTLEDVNSSLFIKDGIRYIEENKMKVALISPPSSSEFSPICGEFKNGFDHEKVEIYSEEKIHFPEPMVSKNVEHNVANGVLKLEENMELNSEHKKELKTVNDDELKPEKNAEFEVLKDLELNMVKNVEELKPQIEANSKASWGMEVLKLMEVIQQIKSKLDGLDSKLNEFRLLINICEHLIMCGLHKK